MELGKFQAEYIGFQTQGNFREDSFGKRMAPPSCCCLCVGGCVEGVVRVCVCVGLCMCVCMSGSQKMMMFSVFLFHTT